MRRFVKKSDVSRISRAKSLLAVASALLVFLPACRKAAQQPGETSALTQPAETDGVGGDKPLTAVEQAAAALEKTFTLQEERRLAAERGEGGGGGEVDYDALEAAGAYADAQATPPPPAPASPPEPAISGAPAEAAPVASAGDGEAGAIADAFSGVEPASRSRAELSARLVEIVRQAIREDADPLQAALPLIGLGLVEPGVSEPEMRALLEPLSPPEKATVLAVRELLAKVAAGELSSTDPKALAAALTHQRDALLTAAGVGLSPGTIALCARVESFGQFTPLTSNRLLSGRANAAIAYTEVRGFVQRPTAHGTSGHEGFTVELSQEIALYTDSDRPVLQWRVPEQIVRSFSRSERQDFYLVQRLDFPRTLAAGSYQLRIIVRDKNAGESGVEAAETTPRLAMFEATIPVEVVADPALLRVPSSATVVEGHRP